MQIHTHTPICKQHDEYKVLTTSASLFYTHYYSICGLHACLCLQRAVDSLELDGQTVVSSMWVLSVEPGSFARAASPLNHSATSPDPFCCILKINNRETWNLRYHLLHFLRHLLTASMQMFLHFCTTWIWSARLLGTW